MIDLEKIKINLLAVWKILKKKVERLNLYTNLECNSFKFNNSNAFKEIKKIKQN